MDKEKLDGLTLQISTIFARLNILKKALPSDSLKEYDRLIEQKKEEWKEKYEVNQDQLDEWLQ